MKISYSEYCLNQFNEEYNKNGIMCRVTNHVIDTILKDNPIIFHMKYVMCDDCIDNGISGCDVCYNDGGYGRYGYMFNSEPNEPNVLECKDKMINEI